MRPIDKGACPETSPGVRKMVGRYADWRKDLIDRIGSYCAYCNMPLTQALQVDHVVPKVPVPGMPAGPQLDWNNMILACGPCNRAKWNYPCDDTLYYLPESHNTHLPFRIVAHSAQLDAAIVETAVGLSSVQLSKSKDTIGFFHLQVFDSREAIVDLRWRMRYTAMLSVASAKRAYTDRKGSPTFNAVDASQDIAIRARDVGFFSLWYEAFAAEPLVMEQLVNNTIIPGTAQNCFDSNSRTFAPVPRNHQNTADPF